MGPTWRVEDEADAELTGTPLPLMVAVRALGDALRRTWRIWVGAAIVGGVLGVGALVAAPRPPTATTTLLMVSPASGAESAMTTDITLLMNRGVAARVVADLGLAESPEALLSGVTATPVSDQILTVTAGGPSDAAAVARLTSLVKHFLEFRATQLRSVSDGLVAGYETRLADVRKQIAGLTREYSRIAAAPRMDQGRLNEVVTARNALTTRTTELQQNIGEATIQTDAAINATHVIDVPVTTPSGSRRQLVLFALSGALLCAAAAIGVILFRALTTDRVYRRSDVASALGVPVRVGVGRLGRRTPSHRATQALSAWVARRLRGHPRRWTRSQQDHHLEALVQGLGSALAPRFSTSGRRRGATATPDQPARLRNRPTTLGVVAVDRADVAAAVVWTLAERLTDRGIRVLLVDLSASGALPGATATDGPERAPGWPGPVLFRPESDPALTSGPRGHVHRRRKRPEDGSELSRLWDEAELVLALVEVDPGIDLDVLGTWVSRVVPLVSAGRASAEHLATLTALLRGSGLDIPFALLEGTDRSDKTLGQPAPTLENRDEQGAVQAQ